MRHPRSTRFVTLLAFGCTALSLALIAPATGGGGGELAQVEAKLATCRKDLADAREAVQGTEELLALARKRPYVLQAVPGIGVVPISVKQASDSLILGYVTGEITRAQLVRSLQNLTRRARQTVELLKAAIAEAREGVERIQERCGALAEQRTRLRARGGGGGSTGGGGGGGTGAFPGSTATKLSLTLQGSTVTLDLKTGAKTGVRNIPGTHKGMVSGSVSIDGTLPAGWNIYVVGEGRIVLTGEGSFTIRDPIGNQRGADAIAQICSSPPAPNQPFCVTGNGKANLGVGFFWTTP